jgi:SAM-dependent methyltransferase
MKTNINIFDKYANFYDAYYVFKDYKKEVVFVLSLTKKYGVKKNIKTILDIGCGTGGHLIPFANAGIKVVGFDLSKAMVKQAKEKIRKLTSNTSETVAFIPIVKTGDACSYRDGKKYDSVVSMFATMGYLTSNKDFLTGLKTARAHLNRNGLFIFDVWFGPTVLVEKPETRIQEFIKNGMRTIRMVTPKLEPLRQVVSVNYNILQIDGEKVVAEVDEIHEMRFFFIQELKFFLENAGFDMVKVCPFMDASREPVVGDWNISVVAKAV